MHRAGIILLLAAGVAGFAMGHVNEERPRTKMSDHLAREIRATLPAYDPTVERTERLSETPLEPGVVRLPEMVVSERPAPRTDPDGWLSPQEKAAKMKRQFLASMNGLTTLLNAWRIPLFGPSVDQRAAAADHSRKMREENLRLDHLVRAIGTLDPKAAAGLREELFNLRTGRLPAK